MIWRHTRGRHGRHSEEVFETRTIERREWRDQRGFEYLHGETRLAACTEDPPGEDEATCRPNLRFVKPKKSPSIRYQSNLCATIK